MKHVCCWRTAIIHGSFQGIVTGVIVYGALFLCWLLKIGPFMVKP